MNFVAIIGIVENTKPSKNSNTEITVKVEKPFYRENENWFELVKATVANDVLEPFINKIEPGCIIGIKGRLEPAKNNNIVGERIQLF